MERPCGLGVLSCVVGCMASAPIDAPAISVTEVTALGRSASPADWGNGLGSLAFGARGAFPTGSGLTYRAHAICDGKEWPSIIVPGWSSQQMVIAIPDYAPEYPPGTACWFVLELSDPDHRERASYSSAVGPIAPLVVTGGADGGVAADRHAYTLYGAGIAAAPAYRARVTCNGAITPSTLTDQRDGAARIEFAAASAPRSCSLRLDTAAGTSSAWTIRDGGIAGPAPSGIGAYFWGGHQPDTTPDGLASGVGVLHQAGFGDTVRLVVYPGMRLAGADNTRMGGAITSTGYREVPSYPDNNPYGFPGGYCAGRTMSFLECAMRSPQFQQAFARVADGGTIVLTALDEASDGEFGYCVNAGQDACLADPDYLARNAQRVQDEYRDATLALYQTQHDTGKTFILDNWETDNLIYCEGAGEYGLAARAGTVAACDRPEAVRARIRGLQRWFQLRQAGIRAGIAAAEAGHHSGVAVIDGIEMASARWLHDLGAADTLHDIVPTVAPGYVSYSAWDSTIWRGTLDEDIAGIAAALASLGPSPITGQPPYLILGELGILRPDADAAHTWRAIQTVEAAVRASVPRPASPSPGPPVTVMWQAFTAITWNWRTTSGLALDATATINHRDGLFSSGGEERPLTGALRDALIDYARTGVLPPQPARVADAIDLGVRAGRHEFALTGSFPDPGDPYSAIVICDGTDYPASVDAQRADQLIISIPDPGSGTCPDCGCGGLDRCYTDAAGACRPQGRWCTFHVEQAGSPGSPVLGPRHVCPGASGPGMPYPQGQDALGECVAGIGGC